MSEQSAPEPPDGFVFVGRVIRPHGLDGILRIQPLSDNPARFEPGSRLTIGGSTWDAAGSRALPDGHMLLELEGVGSVDAARRLADEWILAPVETEPGLPPGEFYHYQLVGLTVVTDEGENLGTVREVLVTGSNDVYVVAPEGGPELLLPAVSQVVRDIDLSAGRILVHLISGLR